MDSNEQRIPETCEECRFYQPISIEDGIGHCVRYAPQPIPVHQRPEDEVYYATWPHVLAEFRCGDFKAR